MSIKEQIKRSCKEISSTAKGIADNVKLEYKKNQLKKELSSLYETLGQIRYAELLDDMETTNESVKISTEIGRVLAEIDATAASDSSQIKCKICKKKLPDSITYCPYCGTKVEEI